MWVRKRSLAPALGAAAALAAALAVFAPAANAATIGPVYDLDQSINDSNCSLREAITSANNNSNAHEDACAAGDPAPVVDTIALLGTSYEILGNGDNSNVTGDFDINGSAGPLVVDGAGDPFSPATGIDADNTDRIFHVFGDDNLVNQVTIRDVVLRDGRVTDSAGGIILLGQALLTLDNVIVESGSINGADPSAMRGAGLASVSDGTLTIRNSDFNDNVITATAAGVGTATGAGIHLGSEASATIDRSSISDNAISGDGTGVGDMQTLRGAGISTIDAGRDVTITNSLIGANGMINGDLQQGGGIDWDESGDDDLLRLTNVTFSANFVGTAAGNNGGAIYAGGDAMVAHTTIGPHTGFAGAGLFVASGPVQVRNSLFETGTTADCGGAEPAVSLGYNIERGPSQDCPFNQPTDQLPNQSLMDPLADNGGPWQTHQVAFAFTDLIPEASCLGADGAPLIRDQRNALRPGQGTGGGAMCEPGAYEFNRCGPGTLVKIVGSEGNDQLTGTSVADGIMGMGGNDTIAGGDGVDGMCAGDGNDVLAGDEEDGETDFFRGDAGSDTLDFSTFSDVLTLDLANTSSQSGGSGLGNISQNTIENVVGGGHVDTLLGDAAPNRLDGNLGNDPMIVGNGGSDILLGNTGNDGLFARDGIADFVDCGAGTTDTAQTDRLSLDTVVNCESVDALPEPPVVTPTAPASTPAPAPAKKKCKKKKKRKKRGALAAAKCKKKKKKKR